MSKIKKGDTVRVMAGKEANKEGKVLVVDRKNDRVIVEGLNMLTKHIKPGKVRGQQGGIIKTEGSIHASNVMYLHKGKPTRLGVQVETVERNGKSVKVKKRVAKSTGEIID